MQYLTDCIDRYMSVNNKQFNLIVNVLASFYLCTDAMKVHKSFYDYCF